MELTLSLRRLCRVSCGVLASTLFILPLMLTSPVSARSEQDAGTDTSTTTTTTAAATESLDWQPDFDKALQDAKAQKKFVMVDVYTTWCGYCKKLDQEVYTDPEIKKYLAANFIVVKADAEDKAQGEAFSNKFDAHMAYPSILFFDSKSLKEKPVARIVGYLPPADFNTALHGIVESKKYKPKHKKH